MQTAGFTYTLEPSWFLDQRSARSQKASSYHGVPIVVSDLDGDGDNEVISITKDFVLQVISPEIFADASGEVYSPAITKSVRLSRFNIQKVEQEHEQGGSLSVQLFVMLLIHHFN